MPALSLPPPPWVVAHRGSPGQALENTVESCRLGVASGAVMLEVDVQRCGDGELVVFHDWDLLRLAGDPRVVEEEPAEALRAVTLATSREGRELRGRMPTLAEVLAVLPGEFPVNIELKRRAAPQGPFLERLSEILDGRENVLVSSFDWGLLRLLRKSSPLPLAPLGSRDWRALVTVAEELAAWSVHASRHLVNVPFAAAVQAAGRPLLVYTVNTAHLARRLFARGVSGVFSDHPEELSKGLR